MKLTLEYIVGGELYTADGGGDGTVRFTVREEGARTTVVVQAEKDILLRRARILFPYAFSDKDRIFVNGYQSWTDTREFYPKENLKDVKRLPRILVERYAFDRYGDAFFRPYRKGDLHGYDVGYVRGERELFIGSKNAENALLIIHALPKKGKICLESDVQGFNLRAGHTLTLFDYIRTENVREGTEQLFGDIALRHAPKIVGYTSWYNYYQDISEEKIEKNLAAIDQRFNLFQIDDGFETFVGDWLHIDRKKFPNGLAPLVEKIHRKNLSAGIWLAPFVAEERSEVFLRHPDWFVRDRGELVRYGCNWSGFYALDFYHPQAREYIRTCLQTYLDMGFDFFKLDFLYAVSGIPREDKTRAMIASEAYRFLRETLGEKRILGCGAVLAPAYGVFDYMRVGADVSLRFDDVWYMRFMHRERQSTKLTVQNTVYRSLFNGKAFYNDPDVFLLRDDNIWLSPAQRRALGVIDALFGSVLMTSDDIGAYDGEKQKQLEEILRLFSDAEVQGYERNGQKIVVRYREGEETKQLVYDTKKGVLL